MENTYVKELFDDLIGVLQQTSDYYAQDVVRFSDLVVAALSKGNKMLIAGNGGSASEATHIAAEFTGRFKLERAGWPAISLTTDQSAVTSIANDYGYELVFSRQIEALGQAGDVFVALSTSGNSHNLLKALKKARQQKLVTVALLGKTGGEMKGESDMEFIVPSDDTARIQEVHLHILHTMCELSERQLASQK